MKTPKNNSTEPIGQRMKPNPQTNIPALIKREIPQKSEALT